MPSRSAQFAPAGKRSSTEQRRSYEHTRSREKPWRRLYGLARWKHIRHRQLSTQPLCQFCLEREIVTVATVCDHIVEHMGDEELFWSGPFQSLCDACHNSDKQRLESQGRVLFKPEWLRPSAVPLTIVCGAPASGKTSYCANRALPGDVVIDLDAIASGLSGQSMHMWDRSKWLDPAIHARNRMLGDLYKGGANHAWFIVSEPKSEGRQWWSNKLVPERIVVMETPAEECIRRVKFDPERPRDRTYTMIGHWWLNYEPRHGDEAVRWTSDSVA